MRIAGLLVLSATLLASSTLSAKPKSLISMPFVGNWEVNYDDNSCHLYARFGSKPDEIVLKLTRYQPGDPFDLNLFGKPFISGTRDVDVTLDFGVPGGPVKRAALAGHAGKLPFLLVGFHRIDGRFPDDGSALPPVTAEQEAAAKSLTIGYHGKLYRLETGRLDRPLAKLRECQTDLVKFWGFDPTVQAQLSRPATPVGNPGNWAGSNDFPKAALANGQSGRVKFRLDVNEAGAVTNCVVLEQTRPTEFAKTSCQILVRRGKFTPALDKDGKPVRSFWVSSIVWLA